MLVIPPPAPVPARPPARPPRTPTRPAGLAAPGSAPRPGSWAGTAAASPSAAGGRRGGGVSGRLARPQPGGDGRAGCLLRGGAGLLVAAQRRRVGALGIVVGPGDQVAVQRAAGLQLRVGARVDETALVEDGDPVGELEGGAPVRDEQGGPAGHDLLEPPVDLGFDPRVDRRGRVVEDQDARIGQQRPGQRHPLALAAGQGEPLLPDHRVVALRQPGDELVRLGGLGRGQDLLPAGVGPPVGDVGPDRVGEQERVLADQPDRGPQRVQGEITDVVPADPQRPAGHVVEAGEQLRDGRFPRAGGADQRDGLAHRDLQRQSAQHGLAGHVAEAHVVEVEAGRAGSQRQRAGPVGDTGLGVDDLEHADHAGPRFLAGGHQRGQRADRADQLDQVGGERDERAQGDRAPDGQPAAQREHADLAERGDGLQGRVVPGHQPYGADPGGVEQAARPLQPAGLLVFLAEALDHPHAGHGAVHHPGHGGRLLLRVPAGREQGAA